MTTRQSISFTKPNNDWLNSQIESQEYTSKSEVINDLIRKARAEYKETPEEIEYIRAKLIEAEIEAEKYGFSDLTPQEILAKSKEALRRNGEL